MSEQEKFIDALKEEIGDEIISALVYGDGECLVVTENLDFSILKRISKITLKFNRDINFPLFLKRSGITNACDVFPLEFINMKVDYRVIYGEDILGGLTFKREDVARELEFELRTKLITLRQGFLSANSDDAVRALIKRAVPTMRPVCAGLLFIKNQEIPGSKDEILDADYRVNTAVLKNIKTGTFENPGQVIEQIMKMLEDLIGSVDVI